MKPRFYGWTLVGVGFLLYGMGMAPAYYSWGFFAPEVIEEFGLSRQQVREVFGTFTLVFALTSTVAAAAIHRLGLRVTVTAGALVGTLAWFLVSRAHSLSHFYLSYSLLGGIGIGLSTLLPAQTLPIYWFSRYRARATALVLLGAAVFGAVVTPIDALLLRHFDWRTAWLFIAATSLFVALIAAVFVRNRPEDLGQQLDGDSSAKPPAPTGSLADVGVQAPTVSNDPEAASLRTTIGKFTFLQAIATPQFLIATFADIATALPWRVLTAHGRLHLENLGFTPTVAAAILGVRVGMSGVGRLSGALSDFLPPTRMMALALVINGLGIGGLRFAETPAFAYACVILLGIGYGAAFVTVPVVFGTFFGRDGFASTAGLRLAITGVVGFLGPSWAGAAADLSGTYNSTLVVLALICVAGAAMIYPCRAPTH